MYSVRGKKIWFRPKCGVLLWTRGFIYEARLWWSDSHYDLGLYGTPGWSSSNKNMFSLSEPWATSKRALKSCSSTNPASSKRRRSPRSSKMEAATSVKAGRRELRRHSVWLCWWDVQPPFMLNTPKLPEQVCMCRRDVTPLWVTNVCLLQLILIYEVCLEKFTFTGGWGGGGVTLLRTKPLNVPKLKVFSYFSQMFSDVSWLNLQLVAAVLFPPATFPSLLLWPTRWSVCLFGVPNNWPFQPITVTGAGSWISGDLRGDLLLGYGPQSTVPFTWYGPAGLHLNSKCFGLFGGFRAWTTAAELFMRVTPSRELTIRLEELLAPACWEGSFWFRSKMEQNQKNTLILLKIS